MNLRCLIVDDEPLAIDVLQRYVADCPNLELVASCMDAFEAGTVLQTQQIDLILLDITMPRLSGIGFIRSLLDPPMVIFTTAYPEYAIEGFEVDAVDYLVKPISFERFLKAVNKVVGLVELKQRPKTVIQTRNSEDQGYILLRSNKKVYRVKLDDILYLQSLGDYVQVHVPQKQLIVHETFRNILSMLPENEFIRIHKTVIVPVNKIEYIDGNQLYIANTALPIGLNFKDELMKRLNG
jgi:DNA-binding LytR/AlgR family response regulator